MTSRQPTENGFTFIGTITAVTLFTLFVLIAYQGLQMVHRFQRQSSLLREAVIEAVNTVESMKINKNYLDLQGITIQKENIEVYHQVSAFNEDLYRVCIKVKDLSHHELFTLETLAER